MTTQMITTEMNNTLETIKQIVGQHARLPVPVNSLQADSNLYDAGLTSLATVGLMLALENHFNVEFSESMLGRKTFQSVESIAEAIGELTAVA